MCRHHRLLLFVGKSCRVLSYQKIEVEKPFKLRRVLLLQGYAVGWVLVISVSLFLSSGVQSQVPLFKCFEALGQE